jgi:SAM-dependent methyltransferase
MDLGFRGEVAGFYHRYRRGYPPEAIDSLVRAFELTEDDIVVDLGCGTGQLALPMAGRVRFVLGVDPEPDMLLAARQAAAEQSVANVSWIAGADTDMPALGALLGEGALGAVTIGQALHWMNRDELFPALAPLVRPGGGVTVVTNGTPMWLQDTAWSQALLGWLEQWQGVRLTAPCGTDEASQRQYRESLSAAGFDVSEAVVDYTGELDIDQIIGGIYSALRADQLPPPDQRPRLAAEIGAAVAPHAPFHEHVRVAMLIGRTG